ncbi:MAG: aspartate dehydrogenase [Candidatus Omnitrophota bacterium]
MTRYRQKIKKIGIVGCGVIGSSIALFINKDLRRKAKIIALSDIDPKIASSLSKKLKPPAAIYNVDTLIKKSELVIEAANPGVASQVLKKTMSLKKDVLIMSTGGLLKHTKLIEKAKKIGINVYIPSGAICGLDGLRAASIGKIKSVSLVTRKPPKGLKGAEYLRKKGIDIDRLKKELVIFSGSAEEAIRHFPKNINVSATLSIMGIGPKKTKVKIVTSPLYTRNTHEIEVEGEFGRFFTRCENLPSKANPKTSQLAIFSALSKLKEVL